MPTLKSPKTLSITFTGRFRPDALARPATPARSRFGTHETTLLPERRRLFVRPLPRCPVPALP